MSAVATEGKLMLGGVVEILLGINAEGKSLESVTKPLTATDEPAVAVPVAPTPA